MQKGGDFDGGFGGCGSLLVPHLHDIRNLASGRRSRIRCEAPDESGRIFNYNEFGTPPAPPNQPLREAAERTLKSRPVVLSSDQAAAVLDQLRETIRFRGWKLIAVAIMHTHLHAIVGVPGDPDPEKILGDLFQCRGYD